MHINPCYNSDFHVQLRTEGWKECYSCKNQQSLRQGKSLRQILMGNSCNRERFNELNSTVICGQVTGILRQRKEGEMRWRGAPKNLRKWKVTESGKGCWSATHKGFHLALRQGRLQQPHLRCWLGQTVNFSVSLELSQAGILRRAALI